MHIAAKRNHMDIARIILDHGGKPNVESKVPAVIYILFPGLFRNIDGYLAKVTDHC